MLIFTIFTNTELTLNERTNERYKLDLRSCGYDQKSGKMNHSEYLAMRGIPNDSFLPLDRNIAINVELILYRNGAGTQ